MESRQQRVDGATSDPRRNQRSLRRELPIVNGRADAGQISDTEIGVQSEPGCDFLAKRQAPLITDNAVACALTRVTCRDDQAKSRRERRLAGPFFERLVAVI